MRDQKEGSAQTKEVVAESSYFDNLPIEGWFWELIRREERFRKRFDQIDRDAGEYAAFRLSPDDYRRRLKNYRAHLRRYGLQVCASADAGALGRLLKAECYLFLPLPGKVKMIPVPRPDVAYPQFGEGLKPGPRRLDPPKTGFTRAQIRKLLAKYNLLQKREIKEGPP
ncbi:MAG: hypothetical protein ABSC19_01850 [Syntrophorhabdales bacterium]|jgi:hypothetical protein